MNKYSTEEILWWDSHLHAWILIKCFRIFITNKAYLSIKMGKHICRLDMIYIAKKDKKAMACENFWVSFLRCHRWQKGANIASIHDLCFPCSEEYSRKCAQINSLLLVALSLFYSNVLTISSQPWFKTCAVNKRFKLLLYFHFCFKLWSKSEE